jgi:septum site-determining protein MinD
MKARTIGIISIKGGVGKTTSTINIGTGLAELGKKVLLVDADYTSPNLALHFGIVAPDKTLHHVFRGKINIQEAIHSYADNLDILPCSLMTQKVNPLLLKEKLQSLKRLYDFIVIDASPALNETMLSTICASDELLVVTSPDYPTLNATMHAVRVARKQKTPITGLVVNKVRGKKFELTREEIEDAAGVPIIGAVFDDIAVPSSVADTLPALLHKPRAHSSRSFRKVAAHLADVDTHEGFFSSLRQWFSRRGR